MCITAWVKVGDGLCIDACSLNPIQSQISRPIYKFIQVVALSEENIYQEAAQHIL